MGINKSHLRMLLATTLVILVALPLFGQKGKGDFTRYVALGDSFGAGVVNAALVNDHQKKSYVAVIAGQAGAPDFQYPLISQPGIPPELQLVSLFPLTIAPKASTPGAPQNIGLARPYNNLSIPGARANDLLVLTGFATPDTTAKLFAQIILRGLGTSVEQTLSVQPTFISLWIGGNDVLGAVLAGTPLALTPIDEFEADYHQIVETLVLGVPAAGMVLGSVADATSVPFATTIPPVIVDPATRQPVLIDGAPIYMIADLGGGVIGQLPPGSLVTLGASGFLATGFGIPAQLAPFFPPLPDIGKPLPDGVVLTPTELAIINERVSQVNDVIFATGREFDVPVVDIDTFFEHAKAGIDFGGTEFNAEFLTGGIFSYDGFHPSDLGYALIGNEFIRKINSSYGTKIPFKSLAEFYDNNASDGRERSHRRRYENQLSKQPFLYTHDAWIRLMEISGAGQGVRMPDPIF